jgi:uncharacterized protein YecT (DUF1311 family)
MKYLSVLIIFLLAGCVPATPEAILIIVTTTPTASPQSDCFDTTMTQGDMNNCASEQRDLAEAALAETLAAIKLPPEELETFQQLQSEWRAYMEDDCMFLYGQMIQSEDGSLHYARGSMAPMLVAGCMAQHIEARNRQLINAYLSTP